MPDRPVLASVVIPVKDDEARLRKCLVALQGQTLLEPFEVIVVDNGSARRPEAVVESFDNARLIFEAQPGSYAARNLGVRSARGEILAFTDSDCIPATDWLERGCARLEEAGPSAFLGGAIELFPRDSRSPTPTEVFELAQSFPQEQYVARGFSATANLIVRRSTFLEVGEFSNGLVSGGDREWGERATGAGVQGVYADDVRVAHPARRSLGELGAKVRRLQAGIGQVREQRGQPALGLHVLRAFMPPPRSLIVSRVEPPTARSRATFVGVLLCYHYWGAWERLRVALRRWRAERSANGRRSP